MSIVNFTGSLNYTDYSNLSAIEACTLDEEISESSNEKKDPISDESLEKIQNTATFVFYLKDMNILQRIAYYLDLSDINALMRTEKESEKILSEDIFWGNLAKHYINSQEILKNKEDVKNYILDLLKTAKSTFFNDTLYLLEPRHSSINDLNCMIKKNLKKIGLNDINTIEESIEIINALKLYCYLSTAISPSDFDKYFIQEIKQIDSYKKLKALYAEALNWFEHSDAHQRKSFKMRCSFNHDLSLTTLPISVFKYYTSLEELDLSGNITSLPNNLAELLPNLKILNLEGNRLTNENLNKIAKFKNLEDLNLVYNNISNATPEFLEFLKNLKKIDLRLNSIDIPKEISDNNDIKVGNKFCHKYFLNIFLISIITMFFGFADIVTLMENRHGRANIMEVFLLLLSHFIPLYCVKKLLACKLHMELD